MRMPVSELPDISEAEAVAVKQNGVDTVRHRRGLALRKLAQQREEKQGVQLAARLQQVLSDLNLPFQVVAIVRTSLPVGWRVDVRSNSEAETESFVLAQKTVESLVDGTATPEEMRGFGQQLRAQLRKVAVAVKVAS